MLIYRTRLHNTSNALTLLVSAEQIRLQIPPKLFEVKQLDPADDQALNCRLLLVQRRKMHGPKGATVSFIAAVLLCFMLYRDTTVS